uniref:TSA: Wollemia nobilis Ref_Wollemi_Transcript_9469_962 transcribed RNA sequence n=1 Tax=Wollemia nobilis TaxID=56998 RepID=A0A0C9RN58_9CONI
MDAVREFMQNIHFEWMLAKIKLARAVIRLRNRINAIADIGSLLEVIVIYAIFVYIGFIFWVLLMLLDIAAGTNIFEAVIDVMYELHRFALPALQILNGLLGIFVGLAMIAQGNGYPSKPRYDFNRNKTKGLRKVEFGSLNSDEVKMTECVVCLESIGAKDSVCVLPQCKHYFHVACIDRWLWFRNTCPICRSGVSAEPVHHLYGSMLQI